MRRIGAAFAAVLAGLFCTGAGPAPRPPAVITEPDWLSLPNGDDIAAAYPPVANQMGVGGRATISCSVDDFGRLQACKAISETPRGLGFGDATLSMTGAFHMRPQTRNGQPVSGGTVRIPIRFLARELAKPSPIGPPTSPEAVALARELTVASGTAKGAADQVEQGIRQLEFISRSDASDEARQAIAAALRKQTPTFVTRLESAQTQAYANALTAQQLSEVLGFLRTPLGAGFAGWDPDSAAMEQTIDTAATRAAVVAARREFCARTNCDPSGDRLALMRDAEGPKPKVSIPNPVWATQPDDQTIEQARPPLAKQLGVRGVVRLTCVVGKLGGIGQCAVASETPAGLGFGPAALALAGRFRVETSLLALGADGETVAVIVAFPEVEADDVAQIDVTPRSDAAKRLALELIAATESRDAMRAAWRARLSQPDARPDGLSAADFSRVLDALDKASDVGETMARDMRAAWTSRRFTDAELQAGLRFYRSPAGQAWRLKGPAVQVAMAEQAVSLVQHLWYDAGVSFCAAWDCGPGALDKAPYN